MSQLYKDASNALRDIVRYHKGIKEAVFNSKARNKKKLFAIVSEVLKYQRILEEIILATSLYKVIKTNFKKSKHSRKQRNASREMPDHVDPYILTLMVFDRVLGSGIQGGGSIKRLVVQHDEQLRGALQRMLQLASVQTAEQILPQAVRCLVKLPRYVRVNTMKTTISETYTRIQSDVPQDIKSLDDVCDEHVPDLLVLPNETQGILAMHPWVKEGKIVLQDKASCFAATALFVPNSSEKVLAMPHTLRDTKMFDVIDACSAPGNKTSHAAALMQKLGNTKGKIYAFERDKKRSQLLQRRMDDLGANNVQVKLQDFLTSDVEAKEFSNVRAVMVDPSCSGSGMVHRFDHAVSAAASLQVPHVAPQEADRGCIFPIPIGSDKETVISKGRHKRGRENSRQAANVGRSPADIAKLSEFQERVVLHAFKFPAAHRITYSTCSLHEKENEEVVRNVLAAQNDFLPPQARYKLVKALPQWHRRGHSVDGLTAEQSDCFVRVDPYQDKASGFFLALFERETSQQALRMSKS